LKPPPAWSNLVLFNDPHFLLAFLPLTLVAYLVARRLAGARAVLGVLVIASILFYGWWNPLYLPLLGGLAVFNFAVARWISAARERQMFGRVHLLLTFGVTTDLLVLAYFKYADFLIGTTNVALGSDIPFQHIVLPLGISFFTFQKIAYLVDASRGNVAKHDFLEYCFFVMFFPQLIAGPIVHHREIFSQTNGSNAFAVRPMNLMVGVSIFLIGLFKKVVLADHLAPFASGPFASAAAGDTLNFFSAWQGAVAYTLQLYFDFSGYSDMAIGAARMFGIRLPLNFESPYQATSIIDFWQRWHMTLSRFLRDYLYIPLGGNRHGVTRRYVNLMLTMTIGGLWHGAAWTYVLWGFLHGLYLVINHAWRAVWTPIDAWWSRAVARLVTFVAVVVALVMFRATSFEAAISMYRGMTNLPVSLLPVEGKVTAALGWLGIRFESPPVERADLQLLLWAALWIAILWFVPNTQQLMSGFRPAFNYSRADYRRDPPLLDGIRNLRSLRWRPGLAHAAWVGILAALAFLSLQHVSEFLYFEF
jgi:alginate O-acetyltransferase complex protein AlgI